MRLIDVDRLIKDCNVFDAWDAQIVKAWCDDQPTAYDIERVVEEIKSWSPNHFDMGDVLQIDKCEAIDIVKRGGVNEM